MSELNSFGDLQEVFSFINPSFSNPVCSDSDLVKL